jgi:hypothetical protein
VAQPSSAPESIRSISTVKIKFGQELSLPEATISVWNISRVKVGPKRSIRTASTKFSKEYQYSKISFSKKYQYLK